MKSDNNRFVQKAKSAARTCAAAAVLLSLVAIASTGFANNGAVVPDLTPQSEVTILARSTPYQYTGPILAEITHCNGTVIAPNVILTIAACVQYKPFSGVRGEQPLATADEVWLHIGPRSAYIGRYTADRSEDLFLRMRRDSHFVRATAVKLLPVSQGSADYVKFSNQLALVYVPVDLRAVRIVRPIGTVTPQVNEKIYLSSFGVRGIDQDQDGQIDSSHTIVYGEDGAYNNSGILRQGWNTIASFEDDQSTFYFNGSIANAAPSGQVSAAFRDAGGAIINQNGHLVGLVKSVVSLDSSVVRTEAINLVGLDIRY